MSRINAEISQAMQAVDDAESALARGGLSEAESIRSELLTDSRYGSAMAAAIIERHIAAYVVEVALAEGDA